MIDGRTAVETVLIGLPTLAFFAVLLYLVKRG